jgi:large repetitive protein
MKTSTRIFTLLLTALIVVAAQTVRGQNVLNPNDTLVTFNPADTPKIPAPPIPPFDNTIHKWLRTVRMSWNTNQYKCYIYNGCQFRLCYPLSYNPTANDGKKYPMLVFDHGEGEIGSVYDNEESLVHGGQIFANAVTAGTFDGYVLVMQCPDGWGTQQFIAQRAIIDYMIANNKLDPFRVVGNGLSGGGAGTWGFFTTNPTYNAAILPMSADAIQLSYPDTVNLAKYTTIWNIHGGLDNSPAPYTAAQVLAAFQAAGANYTDLDMTTQGHDTWDSTWSMPAFWPFVLNGYCSNPWTLFGQTLFCPGVTPNVTIGLAPGFQAYQWELNGVLQPQWTTNSIHVTANGTYSARVERNGNWSNWSPVPVVIGVKQPTNTPPISVVPGMSDVIPAPNGQTSVNLQVPDTNYISFTWEQPGNSTVLGTSEVFKATAPGQYIASVTQQFGCSSNWSPPFTVINANGPNPPSAAANLVATALSSFTQVQLEWARNPHPTNPETGFEVYRSLTAGGTWTFVAKVPADTVDYLDQGLTPNTTYYYVVRTIDSSAAAPLSNQAVAVTASDKTPPTAPGNLQVVTTSSSSVSLIWNSATDNVAVTGYYIYINGQKSYATPAGDTTFTVADLNSNQEYSFYVVAVDGSGNVSAHSNQVSAPTINSGLSYSYYNLSAEPNVLPDFPTLTPAFSGNMPNVSIANATQTTNFAYLWNGYITIPVTGKYVFQTVSDDGSAVWLGSLNQTAYPYSFTGKPIVNANQQQGATATNSATLTLQAGVYPISIGYFQAEGGLSMALNWETPQSGGSFVAIPNSAFLQTFKAAGTAPARPTVVTAAALAYNKVNMSWTSNSQNQTGYEIYRTSNESVPYSIVTTVGSNATSFVDSTVQGGTTYFYKVQAINQYGGSGFDSASVSGVQYAYYQGAFTTVPAFSTLTPLFTGTLNNYSLSPSTATTNFAFLFTSWITIPTTGSYTFYTTSDDGSELWVGGIDNAHLVVNNNFEQGATQRSGTVSLTKGRYPVYVGYFQAGGAYTLSVAYKGPGIAQQNIPDAAFYATSMVTTPATPPAPSKPYGGAATALSSSKVSLQWKDSSATVSSYEVYRSIADSAHFIPIVSVASTTTSYADSGLFSNQIYFYKVVAVGAGGSSAYSSTVSATTPDVLPVITNIGNLNARYGTTTTVNVTASTVNSGGLKLTASTLPTFGSFVDNGNETGTLTFNPSSGNVGNFPGLYIVATDAFGGTDTAKFSLSVNNFYSPVIGSLSNITMNEGDTLTVPLSATDQNTADTLSMAVSGVPAGYTLTPTGNGAANLFIHPGYAAAGTYTVTVTAHDNNGLNTTGTFVLTVNYKNPNTKIYTRVSNGDPTALGLPWNALQGTTTNNLLDSTGNTTSVGLSFTPSTWWNTSNDGSPTGNNTGVYPDVVLQDYMWFGAYYGGPNTISGTVTGLDTTQTYTLTFFSSSTYNGIPNNGTTTYTVGSQTVSLAVQGNQQNTATITGITPQTGGVIPFTLGLGANTMLGYINALVITKQYNDGTAPAGASGLTGVPETGAVLLNWKDSAYNATGYQIWRAPAGTGVFSLIGTASGNFANGYIDSTVTSHTQYLYTVQAFNSNGVSGYTDTVSLTTLNRVPKITAIANITMVDTQSVTVNVTTTDDPTAQLTLTAANLPPFATFTDNGNGTGVLNISPTAGTTGVYSNVTITVTDQYDSTASTSFTVAVTEPNVQSVYLNFTGGPVSPAPWNSMTVQPFAAGTTMSNLTDAGGNPTNISATLLDGFTWSGSTGWVTGNSDAIYPQSVVQNFYYLYNSSITTSRIQISGLSDTMQYNFVFFNSQWDGTNGMTYFTINGVTDSLQADWNINRTVQINGVIPVNGVVTIGVSKGPNAEVAYINSIVIQGYSQAAGTLLNPTGLISTAVTQTTASLRWQDRSAIATGYRVYRASDATGAYSLIATLPANAVTYQDTKLAKGTNYYYIVQAVDGSNVSNYSNVLTVTTYTDAVYIAVNNSNAAPYPWNNLDNPGGVGASWSNFIDSTGAPTSISMVQTGAFAGPNSLGDVTGNNSGVYPDAVLLNQYVLFPGNFGAFQLSGLDFAKKYDLTFMGSEDYQGLNNNTAYIVGSDTVWLNALDNTNATVTMRGVVPNSLGQINISAIAYGPSLAGWFNSLVINGYLPLAQNAPVPPQVTGGASTTVDHADPTALVAQAQTVNTDTVVSAYPNPFHQSFTLQVPADYMNENVMVAVYDVKGELVYRKEFDGLVQGENYLLVESDRNFAGTGMYVVKLMYSDGKTVKTIKLLKQ